MTPILLTGPTVEPLSLAQAKAWLRVTSADEDELVASLILGARALVERHTRLLLLAQTWRLAMDAWPQGGVNIPLAPFRSLAALRTLSAAGVATIMAPATYVIDASPCAARVRFLTAPAAPERIVAGIEMDVVAGFATAPEGVPEALRQAVRMLVAHWYEQRGDVEEGTASDTMPAAVAALLAPYRRMRLS